MSESYRTRIYSSYTTARQQSIAPVSLDDLNPRLPFLKELVRRHFPSDSMAKILDLGCGHGALIHVARQMGYNNVDGVDGSPEQVAVARRLGILGVQEGDLIEVLTNLADASQDCVIAFDVLEHFKRDELIFFVDEVKRVLKPGGRWIIHAPNGESLFCGRILFGDLTHELAFTSTSIAQLLYSSGFSDVRSYEDHPIIHGVMSLFRWAIWKCIRGGLRLYLAAETGCNGRNALFSQNFLTVAVKKS